MHIQTTRGMLLTSRREGVILSTSRNPLTKGWRQGMCQWAGYNNHKKWLEVLTQICYLYMYTDHSDHVWISYRDIPYLYYNVIQVLKCTYSNYLANVTTLNSLSIPPIILALKPRPLLPPPKNFRIHNPVIWSTGLDWYHFTNHSYGSVMIICNPLLK